MPKFKLIFTIIVFFVLCSTLVIISCNKADNINCSGMCPRNKICINGSCVCPANTGAVVGDECYAKPTRDGKGRLKSGTFVADINGNCYLSKYAITFDRGLEPFPTEYTFGDILGTDRFCSISDPAHPTVTNHGYSLVLRPDNKYHFYYLEYGPCECRDHGPDGHMRVDGTFNTTMDTMTVLYYRTCFNNNTTDLCYETRYLLQ